MVVAVAASAVVCAVVRAVVEHMRIEADRERADEWIAMRAGRPPEDELLRARMEELLEPALRDDARLLVPADRAGRTQHRQGAHRHGSTGARSARRRPCSWPWPTGWPIAARPVSPRGVALAYRLVTAGGGPLYLPTATTSSARAPATLAALEVEQVGAQTTADLEERAA